MRQSDQSLTESQRALACQYMPLAESLARQTKRHKTEDQEEVASRCLLTLCAAARDYRPGRSSFATFARLRCRGEAIQYMRDIAPTTRSGKHRRATEVPASQVGESSDRETTILEWIQCRDPHPLAAMESREAFQHMISCLDQRSQVVLRSRYQDGNGYAVAAKRLGCSVSSCESIHNRAIELLRARFSGTEYVIPVDHPQREGTAKTVQKSRTIRSVEELQRETG